MSEVERQTRTRTPVAKLNKMYSRNEYYETLLNVAINEYWKNRKLHRY